MCTKSSIQADCAAFPSLKTEGYLQNSVCALCSPISVESRSYRLKMRSDDIRAILGDRHMRAFDKSSEPVLLYTNPIHDYTDYVLEDLGLTKKNN